MGQPAEKPRRATSLVPGRGWAPVATHRDAARVRIEPFDAIELDLSLLWVK